MIRIRTFILAIAVLVLFVSFGAGCFRQATVSEETIVPPETKLVEEKTTIDNDVIKNIEVIDELGNVLILDEPAQKIVVFAPSALEIINELDAMDKIIGVDSWSIESGEPLAEGFEGFGDFQSLNMEKITKFKPDLIIALMGGAEEDLQKVESMGIKTYITNAESVDRVYDEIKNIAKLIGLEEIGNELADDLKKEVEEIHGKVLNIPQEEKPRVFYQIFDDPLWSAGKNTFIDDLINKAGGINIVSLDGIEGYVEYNVEKLIEHNPQIIIAGDGGMYVAKTADVILDDSRFESVAAVKNKDVYIVTENSVVRTSQNIIKGLKMFSKAIHPEIFGEFEIIE